MRYRKVRGYFEFSLEGFLLNSHVLLLVSVFINSWLCFSDNSFTESNWKFTGAVRIKLHCVYVKRCKCFTLPLFYCRLIQLRLKSLLSSVPLINAEGLSQAFTDSLGHWTRPTAALVGKIHLHEGEWLCGSFAAEGWLLLPNLTFFSFLFCATNPRGVSLAHG